MSTDANYTLEGPSKWPRFTVFQHPTQIKKSWGGRSKRRETGWLDCFKYVQ